MKIYFEKYVWRILILIEIENRFILLFLSDGFICSYQWGLNRIAHHGVDRNHCLSHKAHCQNRSF